MRNPGAFCSLMRSCQLNSWTLVGKLTTSLWLRHSSLFGFALEPIVTTRGADAPL
jgi:hypothetical protein